MADISNLQNLQAGEPLDWETYKDAQELPPPPAKGRYQVRAPDSFTFSATREGYLSAQVDPVIVGPQAAGTVIKYARVSAKPFQRGGARVSMIGDYIRATGSTARPRTPEEQATAIEQTMGAVYQVDLDWEAYDSQTSWRLSGMENFPSDGNGGHIPWVKVPNTPEGEEPRTIRANAKIVRFVAA